MCIVENRFSFNLEMLLKTVYVTVGTTKFDSLISKVTSKDALDVLRRHGCRRLILQIGRGKCVTNVNEIYTDFGIRIEQYDFKLDILHKDITDSDLVIGHAGAGTCMDILRHDRPGLVVINEKLMNNHQTELALQLSDDGYLSYCDVPHLTESLNTIDITSFRKYNTEPNILRFVSCLNEMMI